MTVDVANYPDLLEDAPDIVPDSLVQIGENCALVLSTENEVVFVHEDEDGTQDLFLLGQGSRALHSLQRAVTYLLARIN